MMNKNFIKALNIVRKKLRNDDEIFFAYKANIAMAFFDACYWYKKKNNKKVLSNSDIHKCANEAAKNFLNLWIEKDNGE